jgi:hypothetical protein
MALNFDRLDRTAIDITTFTELEHERRAFWHSRTPLERLQTLEWLRHKLFDYDPTTARVQRVLEVTQRSES